MRYAAVYVKENEWEKASKLWEQAFKAAKNDKKKMRAAFNLALYYEMKDSVEEAHKWAVTAQELARKIDKIDTLKRNDIDSFYLAQRYKKNKNPCMISLKILIKSTHLAF